MPRYSIRLPWEDLAAKYPTLTNAEIAARVGRNRRQVVRWKTEGGVPFEFADEIAVFAGFHPAELWGSAWWAACAEHDAHRDAARAARRIRDEDRSEGMRYILRRIHESWWEADTRRVLAEEWVA